MNKRAVCAVVLIIIQMMLQWTWRLFLAKSCDYDTIHPHRKHYLSNAELSKTVGPIDAQVRLSAMIFVRQKTAILHMSCTGDGSGETRTTQQSCRWLPR